MMLLMGRTVVHIVITSGMMVRSTIQARVVIGVRARWRCGLVHTLVRGTGRRSWTRTRWWINRRILDVHERLTHSNAIARVGATVVRIGLAVIRVGVIVGEGRRISLLSALAWSTCRLSL